MIDHDEACGSEDLPAAVKEAPKDRGEEGSVVRVEDVRKYYPCRKGVAERLLSRGPKWVRAVDGVSFEILQGETFGLVGESGCGKSTLGRCILCLEPVTSGSISVLNRDVGALKERELRQFRKRIQVVFQNPYSTLPPHRTIGNMLREVVDFHRIVPQEESKGYCADLLRQVGLEPALARRRPRALSGGQRQRAAIARALATEPQFVVLDEPVTALDVSVQAQILNLLLDLQEARGLTYLFIAHDLSTIRHVSDRIGVMYLGKLVELAAREELFDLPLHPYTRALISSSPHIVDESGDSRVYLTGEVPSPTNPPSGCRFHTRCPKRFGHCDKEEPSLVDVRPGHAVACFLSAGTGAPVSP